MRPRVMGVGPERTRDPYDLSPKGLRLSLEKGLLEMGRKPPAPPQEWKPWKRTSLEQCIKAAVLFLKGKDYGSIRKSIGRPDLTRQRISQYVRTGCKFLLDRGFLYPTLDKR